MKKKNEIIDFLMITMGAIIAAFAIEDFLAPNSTFDGGIVGVSMIVSSFTGLKSREIATPVI